MSIYCYKRTNQTRIQRHLALNWTRLNGLVYQTTQETPSISQSEEPPRNLAKLTTTGAAQYALGYVLLHRHRGEDEVQKSAIWKSDKCFVQHPASSKCKARCKYERRHQAADHACTADMPCCTLFTRMTWRAHGINVSITAGPTRFPQSEQQMFSAKYNLIPV